MKLKKKRPDMTRSKRVFLPLSFGLAGSILLAGLYFGIMSWAESFQAARELFWADRWIVIPIIIGFGVQAALYALLKFRLFIPLATTGPSGPLMGASGTTSSIAMLACCAHHVTDVLPILGLTAAATFLGRYRLAFLWVGLGTTLAGIAVMLFLLFRERHKAIQMAVHSIRPQEAE